MSDCDDFMKVLKGWREQDSKSILQVLTRITQIKTFSNQELDDVLKVVVDFHREIGKAEEGEVDPKWFELTINLRKKLKKMQETQKSKTEKPKMEKKPSFNVEIPQSLLIGRGPGDQQMLRSLYKNFVTFFDEAAKQQSTIQFIQATLKEIKFMFQDTMRQEAMHKRINSICNRLSRESCKQAKQKMLRGEVTPRQLAQDDDQIYFDEKTREAIRKNQLAQLEECRTGFYDEMKKNVNKDACEQCRYCHQKKAFCEDMKQIRASDQPMTRFMKCNNCNKAWRD